MKTIQNLTTTEQEVLRDLESRIRREFPEWQFRMTLFGSRARGDAGSDSDMDILLDVETEHVTFPEKRALRRLAGLVSMNAGFVVSLFVVDRRLRRERGEFSVFQNIRKEGIPI